MDFKVEKAVLESGVKIIFAVVKGIDNHGKDERWQAYRTKRTAELYEEYKDLDIHSDPILEGFNILHDNVGVKRRKNIPASENLIKLLVKRQDNELVSQLIEHAEFSNLINAIDIYVKQLAAKSINTINNLTAVVQRGVENYAAGAGVPAGYGEAMNYINETKVDEDEFLRYRITERFNQILRDVYNANADNAEQNVTSVIAENNEMTGFMLELLDQVKA